jgi:hypothetical protein
MSTWFLHNLGDAMFASEPLRQIEALFMSEYMAAGRPKEMALFARHESGRLHCEVMVYFTPAAADVAEKVGAIRCRRPSREGLSLKVGTDDVWPVLFPEPGNWGPRLS